MKKCWFCEKEIERLWKNELRNGKIHDGEYCSRDCARADAWGPIYEGCKQINVKPEKS